jgi:hypothetical protein
MPTNSSRADVEETKRTYWLRRKAQGRLRFIRREAIGSLLIWLVVVPTAQLVNNRARLFTRDFFLSWLVTLPLALLAGYLVGRWRWKELEEKYPR